jgi:flagellar biosynthesis regulator FlaF
MNASSAWHREVAVSTFNRTWDLLDASARTRDDDAELLTAAFTSRYHWEKAGTAENVAIADNQVARVAAALGHGALAVEFATAALTRTEAEGWTDWRLASALEVCARAHAADGNAPLRDEFYRRAERAVATIDDPDDRAVVEDQLRTVPTVRG